ncbi:hypothetical protein H4R99_000654 [Coemansia sp. RSA 1722]|nr:hypothetical protein LPJ57_001340 [Coemansia sp. RSA 486]KAJ2237932.1 hypothetical protein IWW45_000537 [Coemansia sp. RSA 485]KAJ2606101.1 hypothetical protein H4R99_000654 [Coemansia sp. RSA 1722]
MLRFVKKLAIAIAGLSLATAALDKRAPLATNVPDSIAPDAKHDVSDIRYLGYGELIHNGSDARCTAIIVSRTQFLVAASCVSGTASDYELAVMGSNNGYFNTAKVQAIRKHDGYDATTFANNLAILTVDDVFPEGGTMRAIISDYPKVWTNRYLVSYSLSSTSPVAPADPDAISVANSNAAQCSEYSPLFAANPDDFLCMEDTIAAPGNANCVTGYNAVIGVTQNTLNFAALYSYSVSSSADGLCASGATVLSYYTLLRNYIAWIESVAGKDSVGVLSLTDPGYTLPSAPMTYAAVPASPAGGGMVAADGFNLSEADTQPVAKALGDDSQNGVTEIVSSTEIISTTVQTTKVEVISAQTTNVITTTTTQTDTATSTEVITSTEVATSTSVIETTVTVGQDQNNNNNGSQNPSNNNVIINLANGQADNNNGQAQTVTVTATATATLSGFTTVTEHSVQTVTASVIMSASVAADGGTTIMVAATTLAAAAADTVTVTTVSTEIVSSVYTVTAVPTNAQGEAIGGTVISTVTEYIGSSTTWIASQTLYSDTLSMFNVGASEDNSTAVDTDESKSKLSPGVIAAIVIVVLLLAAALAYYIWRKRRNAKNDTVPRVEQWMFEHNNRRHSDALSYAPSYSEYPKNY